MQTPLRLALAVAALALVSACARSSFSDKALDALLEQSTQLSFEIVNRQARIDRELRQLSRAITLISRLSERSDDAPTKGSVTDARLRTILIQCFNLPIQIGAKKPIACDVEPLNLYLEGAPEANRTFVLSAVDTVMDVHFKLKALVPSLILELSRRVIDVETIISRLDSRIDTLGEGIRFDDEGERELKAARDRAENQRAQLRVLLGAIEKKGAKEDDTDASNMLNMNRRLDVLFEQMLVNLSEVGVQEIEVEPLPTD
ncbi:MAG: hypothetical protein CMH57_04825 [Myxococcales bacterium]|nr:hypothetical protein [Myxococcales bacterium]